jgi:ribonucleoside-triphosphate reductase
MKESNIGYGSVNHPVDRDPECGFSGIIAGSTCPSCGRDEHTGEFGFERLRRITGYLVGSLERWNDGKKAEEAARVKHNVTGVYNTAEKSAREAAKATQQKALGKA